MNNTPVVVMWPNEDGSVTLSQRLATGHVEPHPDPSPSRIATVSNHMDIVSRYCYTWFSTMSDSAPSLLIPAPSSRSM